MWRNVKLEGCDKKEKYITYWKRKKKKNKKKREKKKKDLDPTGFESRTPAWESNVTTTTQAANYVFKIESSFYIITYSS